MTGFIHARKTAGGGLRLPGRRAAAAFAGVLFCVTFGCHLDSAATTLPREVVFEAAGGETFKMRIAGLVDRGAFSSGFGSREPPLGGGGKQWHTGIDIAAASGTPVRASASGVVIARGHQGGYGLAIRLSHSHGVETLYAHLSRLSVRAKLGRRVKGGDIIGYVGSTGRSTAPHLHFEIRQDGVPIDPLGLPRASGGARP